MLSAQRRPLAGQELFPPVLATEKTGRCGGLQIRANYRLWGGGEYMPWVLQSGGICVVSFHDMLKRSMFGNPSFTCLSRTKSPLCDAQSQGLN